MSIASGYKKFKKYILTSSGFQLVSHWTKANTLEFDDGKTAQDKLGAIDGISSSRESNSDKIAASTALVSELNSDLGGLHLTAEGSGAVTKYYAQLGADSASKKLLGNGIDLGTLNAITQQSTGSRNSVFDISTVFFDYKSITKENIVWMPVAYTNYPQGSTDCLSFQGISIVSYDSNTGRITIAGGSNRNYHWGFSFAKIRIIIVY